MLAHLALNSRSPLDRLRALAVKGTPPQNLPNPFQCTSMSPPERSYHLSPGHNISNRTLKFLASDNTCLPLCNEAEDGEHPEGHRPFIGTAAGRPRSVFLPRVGSTLWESCGTRLLLSESYTSAAHVGCTTQ